MNAPLNTRSLLAYAALGFPLAMAALPIYVVVPKFYTETLGLDLSLVGLLLLLARSLDAAQDPVLGWLSDRSAARGQGRQRWIAAGLPLLGLGMLGLLTPPALGSAALAAWLSAALLVVYLGYSLVSVSYQALGAELAVNPHERTRVTAWREGLALGGVFLAAALPEFWVTQLGPREAYARFALLFIGLLLVMGSITLRFGPKAARPHADAPAALSPREALLMPLNNPAFRHLALVFMVSGIAASIPATMVLFYIADVIGRADLSGLFLVIYFAAGALGMPLWLALAKRVGKRAAWFAGMLLSVVTFVWAYRLGANEVVAFGVVCGLSGLALGADLALPPALLAEVIDRDEAAGKPRREGAYFGLWNLLTKANLALAAGAGLPLLALLGYQPQATSATALHALSLTYALLPCVLKGIAALILASAGLRPAPASLTSKEH